MPATRSSTTGSRSTTSSTNLDSKLGSTVLSLLSDHTYTYFFHALVAAPATWFYEEEKVHVFYSVRFFLGLISTITESALVVALSRKYGKRLGCYTIAMLGLTSGSFFASTSFLPSSFSMTGNIYMHSSTLSNC